MRWEVGRDRGRRARRGRSGSGGMGARHSAEGWGSGAPGDGCCGRAGRDAREAVAQGHSARVDAAAFAAFGQLAAAALGLERVRQDPATSSAGGDFREVRRERRLGIFGRREKGPRALDEEASIIVPRRCELAKTSGPLAKANSPIDGAMGASHWLIVTKQLGLPPEKM
jgi:hypothetical protein